MEVVDMIVRPGAIEVNATAAVVALAAAIIHLMLWRKQRLSYLALISAGWLGLSIYWALLAISAGQSPRWDRGDIAPIIRGTLALAVSIMALGKALMFRAMWRVAGR